MRKYAWVNNMEEEDLYDYIFKWLKIQPNNDYRINLAIFDTISEADNFSKDFNKLAMQAYVRNNKRAIIAKSIEKLDNYFDNKAEELSELYKKFMSENTVNAKGYLKDLMNKFFRYAVENQYNDCVKNYLNKEGIYITATTESGDIYQISRKDMPNYKFNILIK